MGIQKLREGMGSGYVALNILNVNIDKYEQRQCNQLAGTFPIQCGSVGRIYPFTSPHTTGSLCVPVNERREKLEFPIICRRQVNCRSSCDPSYRIKRVFIFNHIDKWIIY